MTWCRPDITPKEKQRLLRAEELGNRWLADGNEFSDEAFASRDDTARQRRLYDKAAACYAKSQYWLDVANKLRGMD